MRKREGNSLTLDLHKHTIKIFSHCRSIHYKYLTLTIPFPRLFLSYTYLSLPHLPCQLSPCASLCPFLFLHIKRKKKKISVEIGAWSESDNGNIVSQTALYILSFIFRLTPIWLKRDIWDRTWVEGGSTEVVKSGGVQKKEGWGACVCPPLHGVSQRKGSTSNGLCRSPA